jgi:hypothetical protein
METGTMSKPYYKSVTIWGVIIYALSMLAQYWNVDIPGAEEIASTLGTQIAQLTELTGQIMAVLGLRRAVGTNTVVAIK